ncbi:MAG: hypothetical protein JNL70_20225 [Saprospiraceae bacterium]|nr:hypothetical protein [Saprospiraceae bacterium]
MRNRSIDPLSNGRKINSFMVLFFYKKQLIVCLSAICVHFIAAQSNLTSSQVLASAKTQTLIALQDKKIDALNATPYRLPFLEKVDLQTETDRFELQRQEYRVRASFNGWEEAKSLKQQKQANLTQQKAERNVVFKDVLYDRYALIVEYFFAQKAHDTYKKLQATFTDKRDVLQKMAKLSTDFNIEDLIKAEDAAFDYEQKVVNTEGVIRNINHFISFSLNTTDSLQLDSVDWLPLSMLRRWVGELSNSTAQNPNLARQEANIARVQAEYNLEKAQREKIVDYAQVRNSARNRDAIIREWSVGVGITIPVLGSTKHKLNEIALKRLDEENKLKSLQTSLDVQAFNIRQDLDLIFKEYDFIEKQVNESQTLYALDHYAKIQGGSPIVLLRMQELVLKRQSQLIALEHAAFQKYIKLLDLTGKLTEMPLKNYLSKGLESF